MTQDSESLIIPVGARVRIVEDCRKGGGATGMYGVYQGPQPFSLLVQFDGHIHEMGFDEYAKTRVPVLTGENPTIGFFEMVPLPQASPIWIPGATHQPARESNFAIVDDNPLILLDDGTEIWGCECWWDMAEHVDDIARAQEELEELKQMMREAWHHEDEEGVVRDQHSNPP
jgi:hypothetical protein